MRASPVPTRSRTHGVRTATGCGLSPFFSRVGLAARDVNRMRSLGRLDWVHPRHKKSPPPLRAVILFGTGEIDWSQTR